MSYSDGINKEHCCSAHCGHELQGPGEACWGTLESRFQCAPCIPSMLLYNVNGDFKKSFKWSCSWICWTRHVAFPWGQTPRLTALPLWYRIKLSDQDRADPCHIATHWYQLLSLIILTKYTIHLNLSFLGTTKATDYRVNDHTILGLLISNM